MIDTSWRPEGWNKFEEAYFGMGYPDIQGQCDFEAGADAMLEALIERLSGKDIPDIVSFICAIKTDLDIMRLTSRSEDDRQK